MRSVGPTEAGAASGISNTFRQVGAVFGVAIAAAIFAAKGNYRTPSEFVDGFSPAFIALGALCTLGVLAGSIIRRSTSVAAPMPAQPATSAPPERHPIR